MAGKTGSFDEATLKKLSKDDLIAIIKKTETDSSENSNDLKELKDLVSSMSDKLDSVMDANKILQEQNASLTTRLVDTERLLANICQYSRRRQLEISTSRATLKDGDDLKQNLAKLLSMTGHTVKEEQIDVAHTLGKEKKKIICELTTRTDRYELLRKRKNLKNQEDETYGNIFINESLCPQYQKLDYACRKLKKAGHIHSTWFFNGKLQYKLSENGDRVYVNHPADLVAKFPNGVINPLLM